MPPNVLKAKMGNGKLDLSAVKQKRLACNELDLNSENEVQARSFWLFHD